MSVKGKDIPLRLYADGVFDSFHIGHANMFKQCRESFPGQKVWLIAGVCTQKDIHKYKGPTISSEKERFEMVKQCRWVDEVIEAPWFMTEEFMIKNDIDFVCHDDIPYVSEGVEDCYAICKKLGRFKATNRTEGVSTTDIVAKILKNKEIYYIRNIKRGTPRNELGMSFPRYWYLKLRIKFCPPRNHFEEEEEKEEEKEELKTKST